MASRKTLTDAQWRMLKAALSSPLPWSMVHGQIGWGNTVRALLAVGYVETLPEGVATTVKGRAAIDGFEAKGGAVLVKPTTSFRILDVLRRSPEYWFTSEEISGRIRVTRENVTKLLSKLLADGVVGKRRNISGVNEWAAVTRSKQLPEE